MATTTRTAAEPTPRSAIPPLENGDGLSRAEFERRYDAMPELKKAELLEGIVYMAAPVSHQGLATPEHAAFIEKLRQAAPQRPEGGRS